MKQKYVMLLLRLKCYLFYINVSYNVLFNNINIVIKLTTLILIRLLLELMLLI